MQSIKDIKSLRVFEVDVMGNILEITKTGKITDIQLKELLSEEKFTVSSDGWLFNGFERAAKFSIKRLKIRIEGLESQIGD